jgi:hypothetical protein
MDLVIDTFTTIRFIVLLIKENVFLRDKAGHSDDKCVFENRQRRTRLEEGGGA